MAWVAAICRRRDSSSAAVAFIDQNSEVLPRRDPPPLDPVDYALRQRIEEAFAGWRQRLAVEHERATAPFVEVAGDDAITKTL